jgi:CheY-like chemotaxis protein
MHHIDHQIPENAPDLSKTVITLFIAKQAYLRLNVILMTEAPVTLVVARKESTVNHLVQNLKAHGIAAFGTTSLDEAVRLMALLKPQAVVIDPTTEECFALLDDLSGGWQSIGLVAIVESEASAQRVRQMGIDEVIMGEDAGAVADAVMDLVHNGPEELAQSDGVRILAVDDEPELLDILSSVLTRRGYVVVEAGTGREALEALEHDSSIAMVLLDVILPDGGGLATLKEMKHRHPHVGVILMSGVADAEIAHHAKRLGAFDYMLKPIDYEQLEGRIIAGLAAGEFHQRSWWRRLSQSG